MKKGIVKGRSELLSKSEIKEFSYVIKHYNLSKNRYLYIIFIFILNSFFTIFLFLPIKTGKTG